MIIVTSGEENIQFWCAESSHYCNDEDHFIAGRQLSEKYSVATCTVVICNLIYFASLQLSLGISVYTN